MSHRPAAFACALAALSAFALTASADPTGPAWTKAANGSTAIFKLATAPFPHPSRSFTDNRVMFFVPSGFRAGPTVSLVIHYHGHRNEIVNSDAGHRYREQFALAKKNAVLIQPQGPYYASDSSGGKHEETNGLKKFVDEVISVLVREGVVANGTTRGTIALSGHSGAYRVMARCLDRGGVEVSEITLHDAVYAEVDTFATWARKPGHKLFSSTTRNAGTWDLNETLRQRLVNSGLVVSGTEDDSALANANALVIKTDVSHDASTYQRLRWAQVLEHSAKLPDLGVPRPRLRVVRGAGPGTVEVAWYPVRSTLLRGYRLYGSDDPAGPFTLLQGEGTLVPGTTSTKVVGASSRCLRLAAIDDRGQESAPSNVYASNPDGAARQRVLLVDGFVRTNAGWKAYDHAFGALVGRSAGAAGRAFDTCRASAITDGSVKLGDYATVVWLAGDQSVEDAAFTSVEQTAIAAYLKKGGTLLASGSELGYSLGGTSFFTGSLRASYAVDTAGSKSVSGVSPSFVGLSVSFGGPTAPYPAKSPDGLGAGSGAVTACKYGDGRGAAIAFEGTLAGGAQPSGVLTVGFPLECLDGAAGRDAFVKRALDWMDAVNQRAGR